MERQNQIITNEVKHKQTNYNTDKERGDKVKIGIITVYDALDNLGSYLQSFALKKFLEAEGHEVCFIRKRYLCKYILSMLSKINPKRGYLGKLSRIINGVKAINKFNVINETHIKQKQLDALVYGSDEIWNMDNPYFADKFFFGTDRFDVPKIAYAISMGEMSEDTLRNNIDIAKGIYDFKQILVRDNHTKAVLESVLKRELKLVCDPTMLIPVSELSKKIRLPKEKYILVYTYGIDAPMENNIIKFAKEKGLKIISVCFWNQWSDRVVQCHPLQFSTLIQNAEYVFTTTFHGAVFTMLNHKKCCIQPIRYKVRDVVEKMNLSNRLIGEDADYEIFKKIIEMDFPSEEFESILKVYRDNSIKLLRESLDI